MIRSFSFSASKRRHLVILSSTTAALLLWAVGVYLYAISEPVFLQLEDWTGFEFNGTVDFTFYALRELAIPVLGMAALSLTGPMRRTALGRPQKWDRAWLALALVVIQAIFLFDQYRLWMSVGSEVMLGLLAVMVAGLVGGWRLGVAVGGATMIMVGLREYLIEINTGGPAESFFYLTLSDMGAVGAVWVGWLMGYVAERWGTKRFRIIPAMSLALFSQLLILTLLFVTGVSPLADLNNLFPRLIANGIGFLFLLLLLRHQVDKERPHALTRQELELARAELRALRAQINPHFLFNSLSVIHHLIRTDPERARELVLSLSDMMQHTLRAGEFTPLRDEIAQIEAYLALEQARLTRRLQVNWQIADDTPSDASVPTLILQPIVENAVKHGIAPNPAGGTLKIVIRPDGEDLVVQIADNGLGFDVDSVLPRLQGRSLALLAEPTNGSVPAGRASIGLHNVDQRLRLLYGEGYGLDIDSRPGIGTIATIRIPLDGR